MSDALLKKYQEQNVCEDDIQSDLSLRAFKDALGKRDGRKLPNQ
jgi:hypothetical protein